MIDLIEMLRDRAEDSGGDKLLEEAAAALEAAREDVERYRWLREEGHPDSDSGVAVSVERWGGWGRPQTSYPSGAELDAAIDQARGKGVAE